MFKIIQLVVVILGGVFSAAVLVLAPLLQVGGDIDWGTIARYVPEILLVVIFMAYTYMRDDSARKERTERATLNASERTARDASWQTFLKEERDARSQWSQVFATTLAQLTQVVSTTNQLVTTHDTWERAVSGGERRSQPGN